MFLSCTLAKEFIVHYKIPFMLGSSFVQFSENFADAYLKKKKIFFIFFLVLILFRKFLRWV